MLEEALDFAKAKIKYEEEKKKTKKEKVKKILIILIVGLVLISGCKNSFETEELSETISFDEQLVSKNLLEEMNYIRSKVNPPGHLILNESEPVPKYVIGFDPYGFIERNLTISETLEGQAVEINKKAIELGSSNESEQELDSFSYDTLKKGYISYWYNFVLDFSYETNISERLILNKILEQIVDNIDFLGQVEDFGNTYDFFGFDINCPNKKCFATLLLQDDGWEKFHLRNNYHTPFEMKRDNENLKVEIDSQEPISLYLLKEGRDFGNWISRNALEFDYYAGNIKKETLYMNVKKGQTLIISGQPITSEFTIVKIKFG